MDEDDLVWLWADCGGGLRYAAPLVAPAVAVPVAEAEADARPVATASRYAVRSDEADVDAGGSRSDRAPSSIDGAFCVADGVAVAEVEGMECDPVRVTPSAGATDPVGFWPEKDPRAVVGCPAP